MLNHENNTNALTEKKYVKLFTYHFNFPELKKHALSLLTVLIRNNDAANVLVKTSSIQSIIQYLINEEEEFRILIVHFLKELAENEYGVKKDRQQLIIGQFKKSLDVPAIGRRESGVG